jgi:hypothetical protein
MGGKAVKEQIQFRYRIERDPLTFIVIGTLKIPTSEEYEQEFVIDPDQFAISTSDLIEDAKLKIQEGLIRAVDHDYPTQEISTAGLESDRANNLNEELFAIGPKEGFKFGPYKRISEALSRTGDRGDYIWQLRYDRKNKPIYRWLESLNKWIPFSK